MKRFKNIIYVADTSGLVLQAFHRAVDLAVRNEARLTVIMVMERIPPYLTRLTPHMLRRIQLEERKAALNRLCEWVAGRIEIETMLVEGKTFLEVIREVLRNERDLVVKSVDDDDGASGWLFGTTDMHLLRKCPCPVWLIKPTDHAPFRRIMAAVDFNDMDSPDQDANEQLNRTILELAGSLASLEGGELHIVHVWNDPVEEMVENLSTTSSPDVVDGYVEDVRRYHEEWLLRLMEKAKDWLGPETARSIAMKLHLPKGQARTVIPALARQFHTELVVMGTVGRTGIPGFFIGNTAESVLSQIDCSVLAVKPPGFVTPVTLEEA